MPWEECYYEAADAILDAATTDGAGMVLTGLGGDELCGRRPSERTGMPPAPAVSPNRWLGVPAFLSPAARQAVKDTRGALDTAPCPLAAVSVPECIAIGSAMYMRRGLWAVHPLATPELIRFCAHLPREWRRGRKIQRRLLRRLGYPREVVHPAIADDFMPALAAALRYSARPLVTRLFQNSELGLELVQQDRLLKDYAAWCDERDDIDGAMPFYSAAVLELTVERLA